MPRILIVDDEPDIHELIRRFAERDGYETVCVSDGADAVELCRKEDFDAIVMDFMMPEMDGLMATRKIHETKDIPVLMLSARGTEYDKLFGFEAGIDDYVTKPFSPKELIARLRVILRRHGGNAREKQEPALSFRGLSVDESGRRVTVDGEAVELTAKEFDLLVYLLRNRGIVLSRDKILNEVWGYDFFGEDRTVDWQIKLLRQKLGPYRENVRTVRGVGYKFDEA